MTISSLSPATRPQSQRTPSAPETKSDPVFDWTTLDNAREIYFMPGVDRLAASLAASADTPVKVRVEVENQFLEYTLDGKQPLETIHGNLNGQPFDMTQTPSEEPDKPTDINLDADTTAGSIHGSLSQIPDGTQMTALVGEAAMPVTQRLTFLENPGQDSLLAEVVGNFACARLYEGFRKGAQEGLDIEGELGRHNLHLHLGAGPNGTLVNEGDIGDIHIRQTFTPVNA